MNDLFLLVPLISFSIESLVCGGAGYRDRSTGLWCWCYHGSLQCSQCTMYNDWCLHTHGPDALGKRGYYAVLLIHCPLADVAVILNVWLKLILVNDRLFNFSEITLRWVLLDPVDDKSTCWPSTINRCQRVKIRYTFQTILPSESW